MILHWQDMQDKLNTALISDARASEIQKMQRSTYFVKTVLFLQ